MPPEFCEYHVQLASDIAVIKTSLESIKDKVCVHIREGEEKGGFRDRLIVQEQTVETLAKEIDIIKKGYWKTAIVAGIIGGLVGNLSPDIVSGIAKLIGLIK